jgi:BirA family biotin operon repressor/biotin-[acetyl-CoA-carboxylase] ligase
VAGVTCHTKWPNDVLLRGCKIAGVLSEAVWHEGALDFAVVGLGLNVNHALDDLPSRPLYPASSLLIETGSIWKIPIIRDEWVRQFGNIYLRLERGQADSVRDEFWRRCAQKNRMVTVQSENKNYSGVALAIAQDGALLLDTDEGIQRVLAGDLVETSR